LSFVCLFATLHKNFQMDLHEIFREGWQWVNKQVIKFWWRSGLLSGYRDCFQICHYWEIQKVVNGHSFILIHRLAALVRRALAEVCTVPVLPVFAALNAERRGACMCLVMNASSMYSKCLISYHARVLHVQLDRQSTLVHGIAGFIWLQYVQCLGG